MPSTKPKLTAAQRTARNTKRMAAGTFYATGAATVAANMYASEHTPIGLVTGFWTPVALFLALGLVERMPIKRGSALGILRMVAVGVIAAIAAWVSYWHLVHLFRMGGADPIAAHSMPFTVDLLMAIAGGVMTHKARPTLSVRRKPQAKVAPERKLKVV
jgi:hypothetical protein